MQAVWKLLTFFKVFILAQVCSMQRFNLNFPGRNWGFLIVTRQETHKELNDQNAQKLFFKKAEKARKLVKDLKSRYSKENDNQMGKKGIKLTIITKIKKSKGPQF